MFVDRLRVFARRLFLPYPSWLEFSGGSARIDAGGAYRDYFSRLNYPQEGFTRQQLGVARRCVLKDAQALVPAGTPLKFTNSARFNPDDAPEGPFIDWSKEYARIR